MWNCAHTGSQMFFPLLLLFFLVETCTAGVQPESASRLPCVGSKLWLALRQAKRSEESKPGKLFNSDEACKPAVRSDNAKADELNEISRIFNQLRKEGNHLEHELERVAGKGDHHLAKMIKTLQRPIQAKQIIEKPETEMRVRFVKVCNWYMCY